MFKTLSEFRAMPGAGGRGGAVSKWVRNDVNTQRAKIFYRDKSSSRKME